MIFLKLRGFMTKEPVVINVAKIVRMNRMKEEDGTVIVLSDGSKALVMHSLDEICNHLSGYYGHSLLVKDLTLEASDGTVDS